MSSIDEDSRHFVRCFLTWLKRQINERCFSSDVVESIEVATQCLEAAYEISDPEATTHAASSSDTAAPPIDGSIDGATSITTKKYPEIDLFDMFQSACIEILPNRKEIAEEIKNEGNRLMKEGKFNEALLSYNKAISLDATNAAFYCNRAAAYIRLSEYEKSVADCKMALVYNPQYSKAYGRMGIALSNLRKYDEACDAYRKALELEPNNEDYKNNLRITETQIDNLGRQIMDHIAVDNPDLRNLVMEMVSDPMISMASQQFASRMANRFPDVLNEFRSQLSTFLNNPAAPGGPDAEGEGGTGAGGGGSASTDVGSSNNSNAEQQSPPSNQNSDTSKG